MKILMTGSSGFVGKELLSCLRGRGHEVIRVVRSESQLAADAILWDPQHHELNPKDFEGFDVLINLAGENIAAGRWSEEKKRKIKESRVLGTRILCQMVTKLRAPPRLLINASAIGIYGDRGDETLTENSAPGNGFLSEVCQKWETATDPAAQIGIQVVKLRFGAILSPKGGALGKMITPFKLSLGGIIGPGTQWFSWISMDDLMGVFLHVIGHPEIQGPVNVVSPFPVTNYTFTKALGKILHRPTVVPMPEFAAKLLFGEMANELILASTRVFPEVLEKTGYSFLHPEIEGALMYLMQSLRS